MVSWMVWFDTKIAFWGKAFSLWLVSLLLELFSRLTILLKMVVGENRSWSPMQLHAIIWCAKEIILVVITIVIIITNIIIITFWYLVTCNFFFIFNTCHVVKYVKRISRNQLSKKLPKAVSVPQVLAVGAVEQQHCCRFFVGCCLKEDLFAFSAVWHKWASGWWLFSTYGRIRWCCEGQHDIFFSGPGVNARVALKDRKSVV